MVPSTSKVGVIESYKWIHHVKKITSKMDVVAVSRRKAILCEMLIGTVFWGVSSKREPL